MSEANQGNQGSGAGAGAGAGGDGGTPAPWYGEANKAFVEAKGFKTADDALVSLQNAEKLIGMDRAGRAIYKPKDANDAEGLKAFRTALGVPEKAEDYKLPTAEGGDAKITTAISGLLHKHGIPAEAGRALMADYYAFEKSYIGEQDTAFKAEIGKQLTALQGEWGDAFDANKEIADRAFRAFGAQAGIADNERDAIIEAVGIAKAAKLFHAIGTKLGEAGTVDGQRKPGFSVDKGALQAQMDALRQQRLEGKIGEKDYLSRAEAIGKQLEAA